MRPVLGVATLIASLAAASGQEVSLICTSGGKNYQIGEIACIPACHGSERLARCVASNGSASWSTISESCPTAMSPILPWPRDPISAPSLKIALTDLERDRLRVGSNEAFPPRLPLAAPRRSALDNTDIPVRLRTAFSPGLLR